MNSSKKLYVYIHKRVRNDDDGVKYFVTIFDSITDVYEKQPLFRSGHKHWVDEWVRRRNGDLYIYAPLKLNTFSPIVDPAIDFETYVDECKYLVLYFGIFRDERIYEDYYIFRMCFSNDSHEGLEEGVWIDSKDPSDTLDKMIKPKTSDSDAFDSSDDASDESVESDESVQSDVPTEKYPKGIYKISIPIQIGEKVCINSMCPYTKDVCIY